MCKRLLLFILFIMRFFPDSVNKGAVGGSAVSENFVRLLCHKFSDNDPPYREREN